jgi:tRNA pseudouridine38-40 synthase
MRTLKIVLAYDGADFVGWQRQPTGVSVQGKLEEALAAIEGQPVNVVGAGRTDAGVHALGQVASCSLAHAIPPATLARALNATLPEGVRVLRVEEAPDGFHARYSARFKTYRYLILGGRVVSPFERRYVWHVEPVLDVPAMAAAARLIEGEHDFAALQGAGSATKTTLRTITAATVTESTPAAMFGQAFCGARDGASGRLVVFEITGNGFLRHMVRNAVGTLVEIGLGRQKAAWMADVLASGDRTLAGPTAAASGLFLVRVDYDAPAARPEPRALRLRPILAPPDGCL